MVGQLGGKEPRESGAGATYSLLGRRGRCAQTLRENSARFLTRTRTTPFLSIDVRFQLRATHAPTASQAPLTGTYICPDFGYMRHAVMSVRDGVQHGQGAGRGGTYIRLDEAICSRRRRKGELEIMQAWTGLALVTAPGPWLLTRHGHSHLQASGLRYAARDFAAKSIRREEVFF